MNRGSKWCARKTNESNTKEGILRGIEEQKRCNTYRGQQNGRNSNFLLITTAM